MPTEREPEREPAPARDALRSLEERLARASSAAERIVGEAARAIGERPPDQGWQTADLRSDPDGPGPDSDESRAPAGDTSGSGESGAPSDGPSGSGESGAEPQGDVELLVGLVRRLRDLVPADLQQRLIEALHELLVALRALLDWYIERVDKRRHEPTPVRDIPIL